MANILCIETSTDVCSVCMSVDGEVVTLRETSKNFSHNETIAVFMDECIQESTVSRKEIDAVAISEGPGSYTALRIGTASAKGMCFGLNIPLIKVGTMNALAAQINPANENSIIIPLVDARRMEAYVQAFDSNHEMISELAPMILDESSFLEYEDVPQVLFCGDAVEKAKTVITLKNAVFLDYLCTSKSMARLAETKYSEKSFEDIAYYEPLYYKSPHINIQKKNILK